MKDKFVVIKVFDNKSTYVGDRHENEETQDDDFQRQKILLKAGEQLFKATITAGVIAKNELKITEIPL
jgi:hypothetical protein